MSKLTQSVLRILLTSAILFASMATAVGVGFAQDGGGDIFIEGDATGTCGKITFSFSWESGTPPYLVSLDYGNDDDSGQIQVDSKTFTIDYSYLDQGDYTWSFTVEDITLDGENVLSSGSYSEILTILTLEAPEVILSSSPFPPLFVVGDLGVVNFSTEVTGGTPPYTYAWDLDGDGNFEVGEIGETAIGTYTDPGKSYPLVQVTDECSIKDSDTMPVLVANPEDACHPMAQKISDGVNTIFPDQSGDLYTCEDVYELFDNESEENNLGFGRMWKAYHLAESMEELTWEDILDWKLNESGWGSLLQLDRFADLLADPDHSLPELMGLVMSDDYSLGDVRTAVRSVTRYGADFDDALAMILEGANTGDINQAYKLATDEMSAAAILEEGVQAYRESLRDEDKAARDLLREENKNARAGEEKQAAQTEDKTQETAEKLAKQYSAEFGDVMDLLNGCEENWGCVRKALRDQEQEIAEGDSDRDLQTALQIGAKYESEQEVVLAWHKATGEDWANTRAHFRELYMDLNPKIHGKPKKK